MANKKTNGTKRLSPSVERQLALHVVRLIECFQAEDTILMPPGPGIQSEEYQKAQAATSEAVAEARKFLDANGYDKLESIASRVAALELQLKAATDLKQYKDLGAIGAALERAKKGLPPLTVVEKKTKTAPAERKPRTAKKVAEIIEAFNAGTKFCAANGDAVTNIQASSTGKQCSVQFGDDEWIEVEPGELSIAPEKDQG